MSIATTHGHSGQTGLTGGVRVSKAIELTAGIDAACAQPNSGIAMVQGIEIIRSSFK